MNQIATPSDIVMSLSIGLADYRFTVEQYQSMYNTGVLKTDDRIELLEGRIVRKMVVGQWHSAVVTRIAHLLGTKVGSRALTMTQQPIRLPQSVPEPDVMLLQYRSDFYQQGDRACGADAILVIEVSDTTLERDRGYKLPIYAQAGIAEYWIVSQADSAVEVCRQPMSQGTYASRTLAGCGQLVSPLSFSDISLSVDEILGPPETPATPASPA